ncbi:MAG: formylmethanofuran dehydrogenase subunit B [Candidatus Methanoliparum thermophilum]|uniref:Formylmethanofuran dehydrogenase subunit B n=1 Tax=Methanoliparum thermophilum TaxID=2491083 RepID=A0A520KT04_METT2|nr:hypothetical protein [Candidatus Methanoliparum sp. LAM-1]RZN65046.1 MAG: formylmethanofuran dehydrogenase subunit B [Candidatus Methanoliparum thermophilum]BDC36065.1 formylmethanofuran dehydrogenase subunit B [Candidatus Methanoliparum sp. LAM-1]
MICLGCSCLCDDLEFKNEENKITVGNACLKGFKRIDAFNKNRLISSINKKEASIDDAINKTIEILKNSKKSAIFGLENSVLEAQNESIKLGEKTGSIIDNFSSVYGGYLINRFLDGSVNTCTLDDVRDNCDVSIYWGCDPMSTHPRLMSKFSYYPRGKNRQRGWEEDRYTIAIDARKSLTANITKKFIKVSPGRDFELFKAFKDVLSGKLPKIGDKKLLMNVGTSIKKAKYGVVFVGDGLDYSMGYMNDFIDLINDIGFKLQPVMDCIGFNKLLFERFRYINSIDLEDKSYAKDNSIFNLLKGDDIDSILIVESDIASYLPHKIAKKLKDINSIYIGPHSNLTAYLSRINIPSSISGVESGGNAYRMDLKEETAEKVIDSEFLSQYEILSRIGEGL